MKHFVRLTSFLTLLFLFIPGIVFTQTLPEPGDPPVRKDIPAFYKSTLSEIEAEMAAVRKGKVETVAVSPSGRPVYAVYYGDKDNFQSQANYNSALGARSAAYYAGKTKDTKPVIFFLGPVHGQEVEGMAGMINLIHIAETGKDYRGREWPAITEGLAKCRVIIIPLANPDGRVRCPYNSFVGLPTEIMTKYGQGTRTDGTLWRWPQAKSLHPMKGNVGILGAYFNDNGINMMHDDFFSPMADETKAILRIARDEAPDMTVSLHSHKQPPVVLQPAYLPVFMKERVADFANHMNAYYREKGLHRMSDTWVARPAVDDEKFPPRTSFNLISALHHISGTMSFTFECSHGTIDNDQDVRLTHEDILDIQLGLYQEMFSYVLKNRLYWDMP